MVDLKIDNQVDLYALTKMDILVCGLLFWRPEFEICFIYKVAWLNFENWLFFSPRANKGRFRSTYASMTTCFDCYIGYVHVWKWEVF